jgi:hypothetical protein
VAHLVWAAWAASKLKPDLQTKGCSNWNSLFCSSAATLEKLLMTLV